MRGLAVAVVVMGLALAGCGGDDNGDDASQNEAGGASDISPDFTRALDEAASPQKQDFPAPAGRSLKALANSIQAGGQIGLASSVFDVGKNRLAFGLIDDENKLVYGKTAVYVAPTPNGQAQGPFLAPADSLVTEPQFRSQNAAAETDAIAAIYAAEVPLEKPGKAAVLAVTNVGGQQFGAATGITVQKEDPVVAVGQQAPDVQTDTLASVGGVEEHVCTRKPIDDMHGVSLDEVVGEKPVALLFATPQLCQSRVCGPVVDIAAQLKQEYGDEVEFIHQEVYNDNDPQKGLRDPLQAFGLPTEPWLFTIDRSGRVAARLEGSFGIESFRDAVEAAL
jgi:hypothetical protein